jgi:hypothetical protein
MHVYLLGAGASCGALPLVKDFPSRLRTFAGQLESNPQWINSRSSSNFISNRNPLEIWKELIGETNTFSKEALNHASIDTLAKKLYITEQHDRLLRLKAVLSCFLYFTQITTKVDQRYDTLFASILDVVGNEVILPKNIKILTWNYDSQIEKAFYQYFQRSTGLEEKLQTHPVADRKKTDLKPSDFFVFHLNGRADLYTKNEQIHSHRNLYALENDINIAAFETTKIWDAFISKDKINSHPLWNFSWDNDLKTIRELASKNIAAATTLIIIGYSFPFFNRNVDKQILEKAVGVGRIYLQVAEEDFSDIKSRILSIAPQFGRGDVIQHVAGLHQFYIPHNL